VHDAFWHVEEDVEQHGTGDRNDDSLLEKGNRRKKRLGDRVVFRGGSNIEGTRWKKTIRVLERDAKGKKTGRYLKKVVMVKAVLGVAAQCQRLDLIAAILEGSRPSKSDSLSKKALEKKIEEQAARATDRGDTLAALEAYAKQMAEVDKEVLSMC
jgi:hypothetical protein